MLEDQMMIIRIVRCSFEKEVRAVIQVFALGLRRIHLIDESDETMMRQRTETFGITPEVAAVDADVFVLTGE